MQVQEAEKEGDGFTEVKEKKKKKKKQQRKDSSSTPKKDVVRAGAATSIGKNGGEAELLSSRGAVDPPSGVEGVTEDSVSQRKYRKPRRRKKRSVGGSDLEGATSAKNAEEVEVVPPEVEPPMEDLPWDEQEDMLSQTLIQETERVSQVLKLSQASDLFSETESESELDRK